MNVLAMTTETLVAPTHLNAKRPERNLSLDIIRGLLSWIVVCVHVAWLSGFRGPIQIWVGSVAVDCFMILSGFVMTQLLLSNNQPYGKYIIRRFMRLMPAFAVCILITFLLRGLTYGHVPEEVGREISETKYLWWHLGAHALMLHGAVPRAILPFSHFALLVPGWSISLEFQFYLVLPFVLLFLKKFRFRGYLLLAFVSLSLFHHSIADFLNHHWEGTGAFLPQRFGFFLIGITFYIFPMAPEIFEAKPVTWPTLKLPRWAPMIHLGTISYSTYLVHYPILSAIGACLPSAWSRAEKAIPMVFFGFPIILGMSVLLFRLVEKPGVELGKRLTRERKTTKILRRSPQEKVELVLAPKQTD
jgi:peptidoglycan/LPS O-acetylase OafA/YrhL